MTGGDIIQKIDGKQLEDMEDLSAAINSHDPGDTVTLTVLRDGKTIEIKATLSERDSS